VSIGTLTSDLTLSQNVATTNATASAVILNAGISTAAGTSSGGNLLVTGTPTVSVGSGGMAKLFSGSIGDSTGLTALVGSGSGRFRYNADETTNFATGSWTNLGAGVNAIYRERPSASGTISSATITYGDATPTFTMTGGALRCRQATSNSCQKLNQRRVIDHHARAHGGRDRHALEIDALGRGRLGTLQVGDQRSALGGR
jgi:hypothetical protein